MKRQSNAHLIDEAFLLKAVLFKTLLRPYFITLHSCWCVRLFPNKVYGGILSIGNSFCPFSHVIHQVWSLTQFYSFGFLQSRVSVNYFYKHMIKVRNSCVPQCPGTSAPSVLHSTVLRSVKLQKQRMRHDWGPFGGAVSDQKALQGSWTELRELLGGMDENSFSPTRGRWFALQANQWLFCTM